MTTAPQNLWVGKIQAPQGQYLDSEMVHHKACHALHSSLFYFPPNSDLLK